MILSSMASTTENTKTSRMKPWISAHFGIIILLVLMLCADLAIVLSSLHVNNDDSYIFFRFARNYQKFGELTYNPGQVTVGYTSLMWTLLLAVTARVTQADVIVIAKIFMVVLHLGSMVLLYLTALKIIGRIGAALTVVLLFSMDIYLLDNVLSGMESPLSVALFLAVMAATVVWEGKKPFVIGSLMLMAALTRPELLVLLPAFWMYDIIRLKTSGERITSRHWIQWVRVFSIPVAGILAYSLYLKLTFGFFSPSTYIGKILTSFPNFITASFPERLNIGFKTLGILVRNLFTQPLLRPLCIFMALATTVYSVPIIMELKKRRAHFLIFPYLAVFLHFMMYYLMFPAITWRYHVHVFPIVYLAIVSGYAYVTDKIDGVSGSDRKKRSVGRWFRIARSVVVLAAICSYGYWVFSTELKVYREGNTVDICRPVADYMNQNLNKDSMVALDKIGEMGYLTDVRIFDLGGLIDPDMWPCLLDKMNMELLFDLFKRKQVTHVLVFGEHIMWSFLPDRLGNLKLVKEFPYSNPKPNYIRLYEIDYTRPLEVKNSAQMLQPIR